MVAGLYSKEIKGIPYLLSAIRQMIDNGYSVHLHIVGGGEYLEYFITEAEHMHLSENSTFYGGCQQDMVTEIVSEMDFTVSASIF